MLRSTLIIGFLALLTNTAMYSPVTRPTVQNEPVEGVISAVAGHGPLSALAASLLVAGLFALEGRRRTSLVRQLEHERDFNRRVWDATDDGMALVDVNAAIIEWNPAMERLTGLARRQALGTIMTNMPGLGGPRHGECLRLALHGVETAADRSAFDYHDETTAANLRAYYSPRRSTEGRVNGAFVLVTGWTPAARATPTAESAEMSAA
jgi:PAS domain S-box-containing protein